MTAKFNSHGYLDAGIHHLTKSDIEALFVTSFPHSSTRATILAGYKKYSEEIVSIVGSCAQLIDGSFTTSKNDPGDVDLVMLVDATVVDALPPAKKAELRALVSGPVTKAAYMCDAYFCPVYPAGHPMSDHARQQRKYWLGEFGFDRNDVPKGIVHVALSAPAPMAAPAVPTP
ncbi:DUF6932 family protein [Bradyrhizobium pachyrhizi]|uniref:DUF6932 family protein n=1 Tax=Bradyrhizobium pachyrhizi TaxID=280333 RepID=UPI00067CFB85|nr:hypothetical protein [Bradyrhizobium pachyrhizi]